MEEQLFEILVGRFGRLQTSEALFTGMVLYSLLYCTIHGEDAQKTTTFE